MVQKYIAFKLFNETYRELELKFETVHEDNNFTEILLKPDEFIKLCSEVKNIGIYNNFHILYEIVKTRSDEDIMMYLNNQCKNNGFANHSEEYILDTLEYIMLHKKSMELFRAIIKYPIIGKVFYLIFKSSKFDNLMIYLEELINLRKEEILKIVHRLPIGVYLSNCIQLDNYNMLRTLLSIGDKIKFKIDSHFAWLKPSELLIRSIFTSRYEYADLITNYFPKIAIDFGKDISKSAQKVTIDIKSLEYLHDAYTEDKIDFTDGSISNLIKYTITNNYYTEFIYLINVFPFESTTVHKFSKAYKKKYTEEIEEIIEIHEEAMQELEE